MNISRFSSGIEMHVKLTPLDLPKVRRICQKDKEVLVDVYKLCTYRVHKHRYMHIWTRTELYIGAGECIWRVCVYTCICSLPI